MAPVLTTARRVWRTVAPESLRHRMGPISGRLVFEATALNLAANKGRAGSGPPALVGFFSGSSGLAASVQRASRALDVLGVPHRRVDVGEISQPNDPGIRSASAWMFHINPPELMHVLFRWRAASLDGLRFGYWAWELPQAPPGWLRAARGMDGVMTPSRFASDSFAPRSAGVVAHPLFAEDFRNEPQRRARAASDPFRVVAMFDYKSSAARKNPLGVIEAFERAFCAEGGASLILKTQNALIAPEVARELNERAGPNVEVVDEIWPYARVRALIASADAFISLHRAEGFGLTLAEAMAVGVPVVATAWSANLDFMDDSTGCMVPAKLVPIVDPQGVYGGQVWAEPDIAAAAQHLRRLRADPVFADGLAARARERVLRQLSPQSWFDSLPEGLRTAFTR